MAVTKRIYRPRHQRQKLRDARGNLIGCTDTSLAMLADAVTFGGMTVTESIVRNLSDERIPDPASPGLNLRQIVAVARKLHISFTDRSGQSRADLRRYLDENRRAIAQVWYATMGGSAIGHAIFLQARRERGGNWEMLINDPAKAGEQWFDEDIIFRAMADFADRTNVPGTGLRFGVSKVLPFQAIG